MRKALLVEVLLAVWWGGALAAENRAKRGVWPSVKPFDQVFLFTSRDPHVEAAITSPGGKALYRFVCHEGDYEDPETGDYNLLFQCKLFSLAAKDAGLDLFLPSLNWRRSRTRAKFSGLDGKCKDHPYYGHRRTFFMRGMRVELDTSEFSFSPGVKEIRERDLVKPTEYSVKLRVRVAPAPHARNSIAGPVPEVCESDVQVDQAGHVIETKHLYRDPAR